MTVNTVYFITGANRGIGFALTSILASNPNNIIFATTRNPIKSTELTELSASHPNIHIIKLDATSEADVRAAAEHVKTIVDGIDVVIANAGIADAYWLAHDTPTSAFEEHWKVNTLGPIILFQHLRPLLLARPTRKFVPISSISGSIGSWAWLTGGAYGGSKAALNHFTRVIHVENEKEGLVAFPLHPGWVDTEMGNYGATKVLGEGGKPPQKLEETVVGIVKVIEEAKRETHGGKFFNFDGSELLW